MLTRQKTILALLLQTKKPLSPTVFVKMVFLLRHDTNLRNDRTFYDFIPYKYGPFSFCLYRELADLRRDGYISPDEESVVLDKRVISLAKEKVECLSASIHQAVDKIITRYGTISQRALIENIYDRFPWYATRSELTDLSPPSPVYMKRAKTAVYTIGYEGKSVDTFFDQLLKNGIRLIIDIRANALSRRYGFSKRQLSGIAERLEIGYRHIPDLGIPSSYRVNLTDSASYQRLLERYKWKILPKLQDKVAEVGKLMRRTPSILMCMEKDVRYCHRSRLAEAVSRNIQKEIVHI